MADTAKWVETLTGIGQASSGIATLVGIGSDVLIKNMEAKKRIQIEERLGKLSLQQQKELQQAMLKGKNANERLAILLDYTLKAKQPAKQDKTILYVAIGVGVVAIISVVLLLRK